MWNYVKRQITEYRFKGNKLSENKTPPAHFKGFLHSPACLPEQRPPARQQFGDSPSHSGSLYGIGIVKPPAQTVSGGRNQRGSGASDTLTIEAMRQGAVDGSPSLVFTDN